MDIGEHDFHNLKRDQHIVVDFLGFPTKFIGLIDMCVKHQTQKRDERSSSTSSHFMTKLNLTTGVLSIVEVNEFNHVSHLNLQFRPGSDDSIKAYLSSSLKFCTEAKRRLLSEQNVTRDQVQQLKINLQETTEELRLVRENTERDLECQRARHDQSQAQMQQTHLEELNDARAQADRAYQDLREAKDKELKQALQRISDLENDLAETRAGKLEAEFTVRKLQGEVEKTSAESTFYHDSHNDTSALLRTREQELSSMERELAKVTAKKEALEGQILDKEEVSFD